MKIIANNYSKKWNTKAILNYSENSDVFKRMEEIGLLHGNQKPGIERRNRRRR